MALQQFGWTNEDRAISNVTSAIHTTLILVAIFVLGTTFSTAAASTSPLSIQLSLPSVTHVGLPYSGSVTASGGAAPYRYSIDSGVLPSGLLLNASTGTVTGIATTVTTANFKVRATDANGLTYAVNAQIYVLYPSDSATGIRILLSPTSASLSPSQTQQFVASVQGTTNTAVSWTASAGTISSSGLFTAPNVTTSTTVTVTATSAADSTKKASANVSVNPPGTVISVSISPNSTTLASGNTQQFSANVQGTSNTAVTWSATAGKVSTTGMFTAPSVATNTSVNITATSAADTTKKSTATVSVTPPATASVSILSSYLPGAQAGTAYSYALQASGGTTPYQWAVASGTLPAGFSLSSTGKLAGTTTQKGQFSFTAQVTDAGNHSATRSLSFSVVAPPTSSSGNYDGPAQLPQVLMQTGMANTPAPGNTTVVSAGASIQNALNNAGCGDTIELAAGATFSGNVVFPAKSCDDQHWIIVRTNAPDSALPPEGSRMLPCYAGVSSLVGRPAFKCPAGVTNVLAKIVDVLPTGTGGNSGPIIFAAGANHYRLLGLEITRTTGGPDFRMVGAQGAADHIILDRVWLHGTPHDDTATAFGLNGMNYAAIIDSYANDFHCTAVVGVCTDAKVIGGGTGQTQDGPFKIADNFLEASGENILFGGGGAAYTPADIEIRGNHFYKPMMWMSGQPGFVGGAQGYPFVVKNHLELKNAQRVLIEGNIFENSWGGFSQAGFSMLLTPKNQASGTTNICPNCAVMDVTIRYNKISHTGTGIALVDALSDNGGAALAGERYSLHDLTFDDISASKYNGGGGLFQIGNSWAVNPLNNISIDHITAFPDPISRFYSIGNSTTNPPMYAFAMTNSIIGQTKFTIYSSGGTTSCAYSNIPLTVLNTCFPLGYTFAKNAIIGAAQSYGTSIWPLNNFFPVDVSSVQFVNFNGGNGGDYHLLSSSPYKNAATDGKDLGADIDSILTATANSY